jgi:hypothetical protein
MKCPSIDNLLDFISTRAAESRRLEIQTHISAGCPHCQENSRWLSDVLSQKVDDKSFDAPDDLIQWLVAQFRVQSAALRPTPSRLRRFIADLVFDSISTPRLVGVRSGWPGAEALRPRQMLYHAEGYDIDLRLERNRGADTAEIVGQILPERKLAGPSNPFTIRLMKDENEVGRTLTDPSGMFVFARVPAGSFDLKIESPEGEIQISQISTARIS